MKSYVDHCSSLKINQIEAFIIDLNTAINENSDVETLNLQVNLESDFLPMGIAHSALIRNADHLFKHFNSSTNGDDDSDVEMCQQILKHSIATLVFAFRIDFIRRNLSKVNQNNFNQ